MSTTIKASELPGLVGHESEPSSWMEITQDRVKQFADATEDQQFIHVDPEKAAETPFGGPVAHGFLVLSLLPHLTAEHSESVEGLLMAVNYGSDRVRFIHPVPVGSRIRARQKLLEAVEKRPGQWLIRKKVTIDIEGQEKPALIAETLSVLFIK
jgi:acyl dehydratase